MDFLRSYAAYAGISEIPPQYTKWCGLMTLAAAAEDRVWVSKFRGKRIPPNLYVLLLGPSGIGKGEAIDTALRLIAPLNIRTYRGKLTAPFLVDELASRKQAPKMLFVTPELALSVGSGQLADDLIKLMTELFTGGDYVFQEGTRTHRRHTFTGHNLNWLAGTTKEWLRDCVSQEAVRGGFFGRVASVSASYNLDARVYHPQYRPDHAALEQDLRLRLGAVQGVKGEMTLAPDAEALLEQWYMERPSPTDESMTPTWKREHDLVLRLAMLCALGESAGVEIRVRHVVQAQRLAAETQRHLPQLVEYVALSRETDGLRQVREMLRRAKMLPRTAIIRTMAQAGVTEDRTKLFLETLIQAGQVTLSKTTNGRPAYLWHGRAAPKEDA